MNLLGHSYSIHHTGYYFFTLLSIYILRQDHSEPVLMISARLVGQQVLETSLCLSHSAGVPHHAQLLSLSTYFCLTDVKTSYLSPEANPSFVGSRAYMSRAGLLTSKLRLSSWDFYLERISRWLIQAAHSVPEPS